MLKGSLGGVYCKRVDESKLKFLRGHDERKRVYESNLEFFGGYNEKYHIVDGLEMRGCVEQSRNFEE